MSLLISTRTELIKTKRSAAFWLSVVGAAVLPALFFLVYTLRPEKNYKRYQEFAWDKHFFDGWQAFAAFLLPMFVILICSLIPQIEYKNNTWKQVFASPQTIGNIFLSKFISIVLMILVLFVLFNLFMILAAVVPNLFYPKYGFLDHAINWGMLLKINLKTFVSLLAIIAIQYWLSLRFRNFIVPIGIGVGLLVIAMVAAPWEHIDKVPYAFPFVTYITSLDKPELAVGGPLLKNHELNSIGYFVVFSLLAFLDMRFRKERG